MWKERGSSSGAKVPSTPAVRGTMTKLPEGPPASQVILEPTYFIQVDEPKGYLNLVTLSPPEGSLTATHVRRIRAIVETSGKCKKGMTIHLHKCMTSAHFQRLWNHGNFTQEVVQFVWKDPNHGGRKTTFFVKQSTSTTAVSSTSTASTLQPQQQQAASSSLPPPNKKKPVVEVIDIDSSDSDSDDVDEKQTQQRPPPLYLTQKQNVSLTIIRPKERKMMMSSVENLVAPAVDDASPLVEDEQQQQVSSTTVLRGGRVFRNDNNKMEFGKKNNQRRRILAWRLPGKTIVPSKKALQPLYRVPDLQKFQKFHAGQPVTYEIHSFLGPEFVVAKPPPVVTVLDPTPIRNKGIILMITLMDSSTSINKMFVCTCEGKRPAGAESQPDIKTRPTGNGKETLKKAATALDEESNNEEETDRRIRTSIIIIIT
jgi:hypothetical protein